MRDFWAPSSNDTTFTGCLGLRGDFLTFRLDFLGALLWFAGGVRGSAAGVPGSEYSLASFFFFPPFLCAGDFNCLSGEGTLCHSSFLLLVILDIVGILPILEGALLKCVASLCLVCEY